MHVADLPSNTKRIKTRYSLKAFSFQQLCSVLFIAEFYRRSKKKMHDSPIDRDLDDLGDESFSITRPLASLINR
jgi:hypothetical protein